MEIEELMNTKLDIEKVVEEEAKKCATRILETEKCEKSGFVYLFYAKGSGENHGGIYKIGRSLDVPKRYKQIRPQIPCELEYIGGFWSPNAKLDEKLWHKLLSDKLIENKREWFQLESDDINILGSSCNDIRFYHQNIGHVWHSCIIYVIPGLFEEFLSNNLGFFMKDIILNQPHEEDTFILLLDYFKYHWDLPSYLDDINKKKYLLLFEENFISKIKFIKNYTVNCKKDFKNLLISSNQNINDILDDYFKKYNFKRDIQKEIDKMFIDKI